MNTILYFSFVWNWLILYKPIIIGQRLLWDEKKKRFELMVWISTYNLLSYRFHQPWKILKDMGIRTWSALWEIFVQVTKQELELDMEQQTGSK